MSVAHCRSVETLEISAPGLVSLHVAFIIPCSKHPTYWNNVPNLIGYSEVGKLVQKRVAEQERKYVQNMRHSKKKKKKSKKQLK